MEVVDALPGEVPGLLRYAHSLVRDPAEAEDLVQETLVLALAKQAGFRGEPSLATWLHRILHNVAVDRFRSSRKAPVGTEVLDQPGVLDQPAVVEARWRQDEYTVDAAVVVMRAGMRAELEDALVHLPVMYRAAVVLHDVEGLTAAEVAEVQGIGLPNAKQRLRRGRMMLVSELARGHERREALKGVPLRCWDARRRVSDYVDGQLDAEDAARVEAHLARCPTCPPLYASLVAATEALHRSGADSRDPDTVVPDAVARRLRGT